MTRRQARSIVGNLGARGTGSSDGSIISAVPGNDWHVSSSIPDSPYQPSRRVSHTGVILHDTTEKVGNGQTASGISLGGSRTARWPLRLALAASQRRPARYGSKGSCHTVKVHASHCISICISCEAAEGGTPGTSRVHTACRALHCVAQRNLPPASLC